MKWKTKEFAKIISNFSSYFRKLVTAIFKKHPLVAVPVTKKFHYNLPFLFNYINYNVSWTQLAFNCSKSTRKH